VEPDDGSGIGPKGKEGVCTQADLPCISSHKVPSLGERNVDKANKQVISKEGIDINIEWHRAKSDYRKNSNNDVYSVSFHLVDISSRTLKLYFAKLDCSDK
jgi:hypothetical protein